MGTVEHGDPQHARPAPSRRLLLVIVALFLGVSILGASSGAAEDRAVVANPQFQRVLNRLVSGRSPIAPGVTAYVSGPHGTWAGAAGVANVKTGEPMRPDARMRLESVSKLWTATLILRLAQQHRLSLDDTVERWLPGLLPAGHRITLRQLLNHTSGLIDNNDINQTRPATSARSKIGLSAPRLRQSTSEWPRTLATSSRRGCGWRSPPLCRCCCHPAPPTTTPISATSSRASSPNGPATSPSRHCSAPEVIAPLDLTSAAYDPHSKITGPHAHGYKVAANGKLTDTTTWTLGLGANGGIVSAAADEGRFLAALMKGSCSDPLNSRP